MAKDMSDALKDALGHALRDAVKNVGDVSPKKSKRGPLSGAKGIAAGAGLAAAAPFAKKGVDAIRSGSIPTSAGGMGAKLASKAGERVGSSLKDAVSSKVDEAGGAGGLAKEAASGLLPGSGGDDGGGGKDGMPGVGKGRRMPVQQSVDVGVELESVYNQFTQFEDWPQFMHRVTNVSHDDEDTVRFTTKIWGKTKEFEAKIVTQRPDERIKWKVSQGITHSGVVTFHELAPRLTRIEVSLDVDPGSLIEKAARGMRHIKRAVRADLARFKAFMEMQETETGAWRGVIEDGEVVEPHDDSYDDERDYSRVDDLYDMAPDSDDEDEEEDSGRGRDEDEEEELPRDKTGRFTRGAGAKSDRELAATRSGSSSRSSGSSSRSSGSSSRSSGSSSRSSGSSSRSSGSSSRSSGSSSRSSGSSGSSGSRRKSGSSGSNGSSGNGSKSRSSSSSARSSSGGKKRTRGSTNGSGSSKRSSGTSSRRRSSSSSRS